MSNISIGRITNNPLCGLCERVCVEVKTITDGCRTNYENTQNLITLSDFSSIPAYPLTFESLFANGSATVSNLNITPEINGKNRVRYQASIVATVYLTDADGNTVTANGTLNFYQDVLLKVPTDFSEPYTIEVAVIARSRVGNLTAPNELSVRLCATIVTRVTQRREIVIPTYGDCVYPVCTTPSQNCSGLTALPTFTED